MSREQNKWNELYTRGLDDVARPAAEVQSVPIPQRWGVLPDSEWAANSFLLDHLAAAARWLDVGCGTGSFLAAFLSRFQSAAAVGVDVAEVAILNGHAQLAKHPALAKRMTLMREDCRQLSAARLGQFDLVYALFSLQFLRLREFYTFVSERLEPVLAQSASFAGTVRSTSRSIPASYTADESETNTFISGEPHEAGMIYHHYSKEEIEHAAELLNARVVYLNEKRNYRQYDPAPHRGWWDFVITRG